MIGKRLDRRAIVGGLIGSRHGWITSTRFASIIFVALRRPGMCRRERVRPLAASGFQVQARISSRKCGSPWGGSRCSPKNLGVITPAVTALRDQFHLPGCAVLQFAFNGDPNNPHLPHHCVHNGVVYTGTHDNDTTRGWYDTLPEQERRNFWNYLQRSPGEPHEAAWELIRLAWSSAAALAVTPLQDLLGLGSAARMNVPGRADGQWGWLLPEDALNDAVWQRPRTD